MLNDLLHPIYEFDEESKEMLQKESSNVVCSLFKEKLAKLEKIDEISIKSLFKEIQKEKINHLILQKLKKYLKKFKKKLTLKVKIYICQLD